MSAQNTISKVSFLGVLIAFLMIFYVSPAPASSYSCGTPSNGHCYGQVQWNDQAEIYATSTTLWPVNLYCNSCNGFVDDETWLVDYNTPKCSSNEFTGCWVEVGIIREAGHKNSEFFWADVRPGHGFSFHYFGSTKGVVNDIQFLIVKDTRTSSTSNTYLVMVSDANFNSVVLHAGKSTHNSMVADTQTIGQEFCCTHGLSADPELFWHTQVSHSSNQFEIGGALVNRVSNGNVSSSNPPFGAWFATPANLPGGAFETVCCDSTAKPLARKLRPSRDFDLRKVSALYAESHNAGGTPALAPPSRDARLVRAQIERYFANQSSIGRASFKSLHVQSLEFLTAGAVSEKLDSLDIGLTGAAPVLLATLSGQFAVSAPKRGKTAIYSKAQVIFDGRSGNLLTIQFIT